MKTDPMMTPAIWAGDRVRVTHRKYGYPVRFEAEVLEAYQRRGGHWYLVVGPHRDTAGLAYLEAVVETHVQRVELV